jgi:hypothetical protein
MSGLYRYIFDSDFWKKLGFRNKRSSALVEQQERRYLEEYIRVIQDDIAIVRDEVDRYIRHYYSKSIKECNEVDERISLAIAQDRASRKEKEFRRRVEDDKTYNKISLQSAISEVTTPSSLISEYRHFEEIKKICSKYPEDPCSVEISKYLEDNHLI